VAYVRLEEVNDEAVPPFGGTIANPRLSLSGSARADLHNAAVLPT